MKIKQFFLIICTLTVIIVSSLVIFKYIDKNKNSDYSEIYEFISEVYSTGDRELLSDEIYEKSKNILC